MPDPELPFLGVHLSPTIDGDITVGPSAVLGLAREGYPKFSVDVRDVARMAAFPGLWRVARNNVGLGLHEIRNSLFKGSYLRECRKYAPTLQKADLLPYEAGIRAQAVRRDGTLIHDFVIEETARMLHVLNSPSPAATAALPIGQHLADRRSAAEGQLVDGVGAQDAVEYQVAEPCGPSVRRARSGPTCSDPGRQGGRVAVQRFSQTGHQMSYARAISPPTTTTAGLSRFTAAAIASPICRPLSRMSRRASGSPRLASSTTSRMWPTVWPCCCSVCTSVHPPAIASRQPVSPHRHGSPWAATTLL